MLPLATRKLRAAAGATVAADPEVRSIRGMIAAGQLPRDSLKFHAGAVQAALQRAQDRHASRYGFGVPGPDRQAQTLSKQASMKPTSTAQKFLAHLKTAGLPIARPKTPAPEKTAASPVEAMRDRFIERATDAVMAEALGTMYRDPILAGLIDAGELKTAASLASGRLISEKTAEKIASLDVPQAHALAAHGIRKTANEARAPQKSGTAFPRIFKRR